MKNSILIFFMSMLFNIATIFGQQNSIVTKHLEYNTYYSKGCIEMSINKDYQAAINYFDSASARFPYFHKPYYEAGICATYLNNNAMAYNYFIKMINTGCKFMINTYYISSFANSNYYTTMLNIQDSLYSNCIKNYDSAYYYSFSNLINKLQSQVKTGVFDSAGFHELVMLCEQYGQIPSYLNAGTDLYRRTVGLITSWYLFGYSDSNDWLKIQSYLKDAYLLGGIEANYLFRIEDAAFYLKKMPQKYGFYILENRNAQFPSKDEINRNRTMVGLETIDLNFALSKADVDSIFNNSKSTK